MLLLGGRLILAGRGFIAIATERSRKDFEGKSLRIASCGTNYPQAVFHNIERLLSERGHLKLDHHPCSKLHFSGVGLKTVGI